MKWKRDKGAIFRGVVYNGGFYSDARTLVTVPSKLTQLLENRKKNQPVTVKLEKAKQVLRRRIVVKRK